MYKRYTESILIDELTHFLQSVNISELEKYNLCVNSNDASSYFTHRREYEAYLVQAIYFFDEIPPPYKSKKGREYINKLFDYIGVKFRYELIN